MQTHESYIKAVVELVSARPQLTEQDHAAMAGVKLVYGRGENGTYGVTYYNRWRAGDKVVPFVEVSAFHQRDRFQLATTVIHELGHVLAGHAAGHGKDWKAACARLGLRRVKAVGHHVNACLEPDLRMAIAMLEPPCEGRPNETALALPRGTVYKGCGAGRGTRGGKSFGPGSGSRLRLFECECLPPIKVRASRDVLNATCNTCNCAFHRA